MNLPTDLYTFIQTGGTVALLLFFLLGFWQGWFVTARELKKETDRADKFEAFYDQSSILLQASLTRQEDANQRLRDQVDLLSRLVNQRTEKQP